MEYYASLVIQGIANGCIYGLIGLSLTFIYRSTKVFNFAQGEIATLSVIVCLILSQHMSLFLAAILSIFVVFLTSIAFEVTFLSRVRKNNEIGVIIVTIGLYTVINNLNGFIFGYDPKSFPSPIASGQIEFFGIIIGYQSLFVITSSIIVSGLLYFFFHHTVLGISMQGLAENEESARLKGVRSGYLLAFGWAVAAATSGLAGFLIAPDLFVHTNMMESVFLYAFAASVIGGLQSSFGALIGGLLVGVAESISTAIEFFGSEMKTVVVFVILLIFLTILPRGILGRDEPRKI